MVSWFPVLESTNQMTNMYCLCQVAVRNVSFVRFYVALTVMWKNVFVELSWTWVNHCWFLLYCLLLHVVLIMNLYLLMNIDISFHSHHLCSQASPCFPLVSAWRLCFPSHTLWLKWLRYNVMYHSMLVVKGKWRICSPPVPVQVTFTFLTLNSCWFASLYFCSMLLCVNDLFSAYGICDHLSLLFFFRAFRAYTIHIPTIMKTSQFILTPFFRLLS